MFPAKFYVLKYEDFRLRDHICEKNSRWNPTSVVYSNNSTETIVTIPCLTCDFAPGIILKICDSEFLDTLNIKCARYRIMKCSPVLFVIFFRLFSPNELAVHKFRNARF
jgi:hypothetical protein